MSYSKKNTALKEPFTFKCKSISPAENDVHWHY